MEALLDSDLHGLGSPDLGHDWGLKLGPFNKLIVGLSGRKFKAWPGLARSEYILPLVKYEFL